MTYSKNNNAENEKKPSALEETEHVNAPPQAFRYSPFAVFKKAIQFVSKVNKSFYYIMKLGIQFPIFISLIPIYGPIWVLYYFGIRLKIMSKFMGPLNALCADIGSLITIWVSSESKISTKLKKFIPKPNNAEKPSQVSQSYSKPPAWAIYLIKASLVIGIISLLIAYIPFIGSYASSLGIIGAILSCISVLIYRKTKFQLIVCIVSLLISGLAIYTAKTNSNEIPTAILNVGNQIKEGAVDAVQSVNNATKSLLDDVVQSDENVTESVQDDAVQSDENVVPSVKNAAKSLLEMFN